MNRKFIYLFVFVFILLFALLNINFENNPKKLKEFYKNSDMDYFVYKNELLETYVIACSLYFNFESNILMPQSSENELYKLTMDYFKPYKKHKFINFLNIYFDDYNKDINLSVVQSICTYLLVDEFENYNINKNIFKNKEEYEIFLKELNEFYIDTKAEQYFNIIKIYDDKVKKEFKENSAKIPISKLFLKTYDYLGLEKEKEKEKNVVYISFITYYRPLLAFLNVVEDDKNIYIISYQSISETAKMNIDTNLFFMNFFHEILHYYVNPIVQNEYFFISKLFANEDKNQYVNELYVNMEWNRIIDEYLVRCVLARVYGIVYEDLDKYEKIIIEKEYEGGFKKLPEFLDVFSNYENNRNRYTTIDLFIKDLLINFSELVINNNPNSKL